MLRKDYLMRLVTTFFESLSKIENGLDNGNENMHLYISDTYNLLGNTQNYFLYSDLEEIYIFFKEKEGDYLKRVEMLAELIYVDSKNQNNKEYLKRAKDLLEFYLKNTKEYSFELQSKFKTIKKELENYNE